MPEKLSDISVSENQQDRRIGKGALLGSLSGAVIADSMDIVYRTPDVSERVGTGALIVLAATVVGIGVQLVNGKRNLQESPIDGNSQGGDYTPACQ